MNLTQEITYDSNDNELYIDETFDDKHVNYIINSSSNVPLNLSNSYPFEHGGWQHNYPKEDTEISLNSQEFTYWIYYRLEKLISTYSYEKNKNLEYGNLTIPTQMFSSSSSFEVKMGT